MPRTTDIPSGIGTKLGIAGSALLAVAAALVPFLPDTGAGTSKVLVACSTVLASVTVLGRMLQAAALFLNGPGVAPAQTANRVTGAGTTHRAE
jgi:hypothetical protein